MFDRYNLAICSNVSRRGEVMQFVAVELLYKTTSSSSAAYLAHKLTAAAMLSLLDAAAAASDAGLRCN